MENIQKELDNRFVLFPIKYNAIWKMYKKAVSAFWTPEEIDLSKDYEDWTTKLSENERHFLKNILAFFAASDGIVNENLVARFMNDVSCQEAKCFYGFQMAIENIHCVAGFTWILTRNGYFKIKDLEGQMVEVWNGVEWSKTMVMKTHDSSPAYCVELSNGVKIICTPNHKWLIKGSEERVMTKDLSRDMEIEPFSFPDVCEFDEPDFFSNPNKHGQLSGGGAGAYNPIEFNCRFKEFVPFNYSSETRLEWLKGFMKNAVEAENSGLFVPSTDAVFKDNVQLLFTTFNIFVTVYESGVHIPSSKRLNELGIIKMPTTESSPLSISVKTVTELPEEMPMYCFEESKRNTGVFNGILTGQSEVYSLLIDTYIKDTEEKAYLLDAINTIPCVKKKAEWAIKWITNKDADFATRLIAYACVEGIFFSGAFCAIFWIKERGILPGLTLSNEFISRDESLHTEFSILLYKHLEHANITQEKIETIVKEAVEIEDEFINESISCEMLGMNKDLMSEYIRFVSDRLVIQIGFNPIYNAKNPFHFMDRISLSNKTNFFEHTRQSEYARARVGNTVQENSFSLEADF